MSESVAYDEEQVRQRNERVGRHNAAIMANRLFAGSVNDAQTEMCHHCGELLHPYPEPEYWMQYPLPTCCILDGKKFHDSYRKPECIDAFLVANPQSTVDAPAAPRKKKRTKTPPPLSNADWREQNAAVLAAGMPSDAAGLLDVAQRAVAELHSSVVAGDIPAAEAAADRYEAVIWKLNGGKFFGCRAGEDSPSSVVEHHCAATPGVAPMWGQTGSFIVSVDGVRARVEVNQGFGSLLDLSIGFHVVDLDRPFISETGYRSDFACAQPGKSVDQVVAEIFQAHLARGKRYVRPEDQLRLSQQTLPEWMSGISRPARQTPATDLYEANPDLLPAGYTLVDVVLTEQQAFIVRKWAQAAKARIAKARMQDSEPPKKASTAPRYSRAPAQQPQCSQVQGADQAASPSLPACGLPGDELAQYTQGRRCKIKSVHHPAFASEVGKIVVIDRVMGGTVWAHEDRPVTYRKNRLGREVVKSDPRCAQTLYSIDALELI